MRENCLRKAGNEGKMIYSRCRAVTSRPWLVIVTLQLIVKLEGTGIRKIVICANTKNRSSAGSIGTISSSRHQKRQLQQFCDHQKCAKGKIWREVVVSSLDIADHETVYSLWRRALRCR